MNFLCVKKICNIAFRKIFVVFYSVNLYICVFMTYSTSCCPRETLMDPRNLFIYVYMYVCFAVFALRHTLSRWILSHISEMLCNAPASSYQNVTALYSGEQTCCSLFSFIPSSPSFLVRFLNYCNYCVMVHSSFALAWSLHPSTRTVITH